MADVFEAPCECGAFQFVFGRSPERAVEAICPRCGRKTTIQPPRKRRGKDSEAEE